MPVATVSQALKLDLVETGTGNQPNATGGSTDPYGTVFADGSSWPSDWWHWRCDIPAPGPDVGWVAMWTSIVVRVEGPTQIGGQWDLARAFYLDGATTPSDGYGRVTSGQFGPNNIGVFPVTGPYMAYDTDQPPSSGGTVGGDANWEEFWLTEAVTDDRGKTGEAFDWLDPFWKAAVGDNRGFKSFFVPPYPTTFDYYFLAPGYWDPPGAVGRSVAANYSVLDARLIVVSCSVKALDLIPSTVNPGAGQSGSLGSGGTAGSTVQLPAGSSGHYSLAGLVRLAMLTGFGVNSPMAAAIAMAESGGDPQNVGFNPGPPASRDRGLWQINDFFHAEVSDTCAFTPVCCAQAAYRISAGGHDWTPWATFGNGAYEQYIGQTQAIYDGWAQSGAQATTVNIGAVTRPRHG